MATVTLENGFIVVRQFDVCDKRNICVNIIAYHKNGFSSILLGKDHYLLLSNHRRRNKGAEGAMAMAMAWLFMA